MPELHPYALKLIFGTKLLAKLLYVSDRSVRRYVWSKRQPATLIASRLTFLSTLVQNLERHGYASDDIRRWFAYGSQLLGYRSPQEILCRSAWDPLVKRADDRFLHFVADLARWGVRTDIPQKGCCR